ARATAVGRLGPAAVGGHHCGPGAVLPVVAGGDSDHGPECTYQQGEHGNDDDATNGGGHGLSSSPVDVDVAVSMQARGDELDVPELFVVDVHAVLQAQCADLLPPPELRPGPWVGAGVLRGLDDAAVVPRVGDREPA